MCLQKVASSLGLLLGGWRHDDSSDGLIKHVLQSLLRQGRTLHKLDGIDLFCLCHALLVRDGCLVLLAESVDGVLVFTEIELGAHQDERCVGAICKLSTP